MPRQRDPRHATISIGNASSSNSTSSTITTPARRGSDLGLELTINHTARCRESPAQHKSGSGIVIRERSMPAERRHLDWAAELTNQGTIAASNNDTITITAPASPMRRRM